MTDPHYTYMKRCYELAAESHKNGESAVGSLIVLHHEIIAEATESSKLKDDITFHAEVEAIRKAKKRLKTKFLSEAILYTTHEPCILCAYAIRHYRIAKVVYAEAVGELGGIHSAFPLLKLNAFKKWDAPPEIIQYKL